MSVFPATRVDACVRYGITSGFRVRAAIRGFRGLTLLCCGPVSPDVSIWQHVVSSGVFAVGSLCRSGLRDLSRPCVQSVKSYRPLPMFGLLGDVSPRPLFFCSPAMVLEHSILRLQPPLWWHACMHHLPTFDMWRLHGSPCGNSEFLSGRKDLPDQYSYSAGVSASAWRRE